MKSFSQRQGLKPIRTIIQKESADEPLRNALWNALITSYWRGVKTWIDDTKLDYRTLVERIWTIFYQERLDNLNNQSSYIMSKIKYDFLNKEWNEMLDILEFIPNNFVTNNYYD